MLRRVDRLFRGCVVLQLLGVRKSVERQGVRTKGCTVLLTWARMFDYLILFGAGGLQCTGVSDIRTTEFPKCHPFVSSPDSTSSDIPIAPGLTLSEPRLHYCTHSNYYYLFSRRSRNHTEPLELFTGEGQVAYDLCLFLQKSGAASRPENMPPMPFDPG
ncbi:hypothetical protein EDB84DRAFT_1523030 [Lactarius hengduanensis]|nr:hypothetical protein EDB84DRAFT_1523030 [Lactarius hengduanensis]